MSAFTDDQLAELAGIIEAEVNKRVAEILGRRHAAPYVAPPTPPPGWNPYYPPQVWCGVTSGSYVLAPNDPHIRVQNNDNTQ